MPFELYGCWSQYHNDEKISELTSRIVSLRIAIIHGFMVYEVTAIFIYKITRRMGVGTARTLWMHGCRLQSLAIAS